MARAKAEIFQQIACSLSQIHVLTISKQNPNTHCLTHSLKRILASSDGADQGGNLSAESRAHYLKKKSHSLKKKNCLSQTARIKAEIFQRNHVLLDSALAPASWLPGAFSPLFRLD